MSIYWHTYPTTGRRPDAVAENDDDGDYWRVRQWARPGARSEAWARKLDDAAAALARTSARTSAALAEALCDAAARGDAWRLDALLARGGGAALQKECRNYEGRTPAHLAASELIKAGGSASSADDGGAGRLRAAACAGDACLIERLIKAGLRPDACADDGRTALHLAAGEGASKVAAKLVELGADVKKPDRQGRNALDIARAAGYYDLEARLRLLSES